MVCVLSVHKVLVDLLPKLDDLRRIGRQLEEKTSQSRGGRVTVV
jgi:hypothetical protein